MGLIRHDLFQVKSSYAVALGMILQKLLFLHGLSPPATALNLLDIGILSGIFTKKGFVYRKTIIFACLLH